MQNILHTFGTDGKDEFLAKLSCSRKDNKRRDAGFRDDTLALPACQNKTPTFTSTSHEWSMHE